MEKATHQATKEHNTTLVLRTIYHAEALSRADARVLWRGDALRREALASAELDGQRVDWEDLVVAQLDPTLLGQELLEPQGAPGRHCEVGRGLLAEGDTADALHPTEAGWHGDGLGGGRHQGCGGGKSQCGG